MAGGKSLARIAVVLAAVLLVVSVAGFVITLVLNAFVLDKYNAYGDVPIPGSGRLHLPAGEVTVSFDTQIIGSTNGSGLPVPQLGMRIKPPPGVPEPVVTEKFGSSTTVNGDAHRQVWVVQIPAEGDYTITTDGQVGPFISPRLAFGHGSSTGFLVWVFVGLFVVGLVDLALALWWSARVRQRRPQAYLQEPVSFDQPVTFGQPVTGADPYTPTDDGVRIQQLKTLAALRDSGALTNEEFEAEKRRVLGGN
jgi:hypothetical protein